MHSDGNKVYYFLEDAGEMGELIKDYDWSSTSIGDLPDWSASLQITLGNILHSPFPMFLFWGKDLLCFYNDAYQPVLGEERKHSSIGKKGKEVWPEVWDEISPLIHQVLTTGKAVWFEDYFFAIPRNGNKEDAYWTFSYSPAYDDKGRIAGVIVTGMETTQAVIARKKIEDVVSQRTQQLKEAHQSLLQANEFFQQLINISKEPIQVLEPVFENNKIIDFRFRLTNNAYAAYANTTPDQIQGRKVSEIFPGYFQTTSFTNVVKAYHSGMPETWEIHYDQDGLDLYNKMSVVKLEETVAVLFTDFSELKQLQLQLQNKIEELERSNRKLEEFAHAASHDLQEPIRKISVFTVRMKDKLASHLNEEDLMTFAKIERTSQRMRNLINDLLSYSTLTLELPERQEVTLSSLVQIVLEDLELIINEKQALIHVDQLPVIKGFSRQLQQLLQNLISNALKYSKEGIPPRVEITSSYTDKKGKLYHEITVRDNGIGFPQEYSEQIFQMFSRLHRKEDYSGTGIGLFIARKVVELHGGYITAESIPGQGTSFKFYLPE